MSLTAYSVLSEPVLILELELVVTNPSSNATIFSNMPCKPAQPGAEKDL
jgi:hypothetical protein